MYICSLLLFYVIYCNYYASKLSKSESDAKRHDSVNNFHRVVINTPSESVHWAGANLQTSVFRPSALPNG